MGKYSRDLDEALEAKVRQMSSNLRAEGITVEPIRLNSKKSYGEVVKANELVSLFTGDSDMVCLAINEELFDLLDDASQNVLIEELLSQVSYDSEKEKIVITKPELAVNVGMYNKYKDIAVQKILLAYLTLQQIEEQKKKEKEEKKAAKSTKKNGQ